MDDAEVHVTARLFAFIFLCLCKKLEELCKVLYQGSDQSVKNNILPLLEISLSSLQLRARARQELIGFENDPKYVQHCQNILEKSNLPVAHLMAVSSMLKLITEFWTNYSMDEIVTIRTIFTLWELL